MKQESLRPKAISGKRKHNSLYSIQTFIICLSITISCRTEKSFDFFSEDVNIYRGNTHTHARYSDDNDSNDVPAIASWYREAGYDFLVLSEHNDHVVKKQVFCHDEAEAAPGFIMLCGLELSNTRHHTALGINRFIGDEISLEDGVRKILDAGGVPVLNHPQDPVINSVDFLAIEGLNHLEVFNGGRPEDTPATETLWDSLLSMPSGRKVFAVASDDNHYNQKNVGRGWIMVASPALTEKDILESIREGLFYSSTGVILNSFRVTGKSVYVGSENGNRIEFIGRNGILLAEVIGQNAEYKIKRDEHYIRVRITRSDGKMAWTQPVLVPL